MTAPSPPPLWIADLGSVPYLDALDIQRAAARARATGDLPHDLLILLEHPPVITLGRSSKNRHLVTPASVLAERGVALFEVERGGDITFHGPGQLVGYPIIDLKAHRQDLHWYLRQLEETLIRALEPHEVSAERNVGYTGVWTRGRKIASIGVHARDWVTWHGFALNVSTDLSYFDLIVPCGISGVTMTSVARELAERTPRPASSLVPSVGDVARSVARQFASVFNLEPRYVEGEEIRRRVGEAALA